MTSIDRILKILTLDQKIAQIQGLAPYELIAQPKPGEAVSLEVDLSAGIPYDFSRIPSARPAGIGHLSLAWTLDADAGRLREKLEEFRRYAAEVNPLGIGTLIHGEAVNGLVHDQADQFPTPWGQAATWAPELTTQVAEHAGRQALDFGIRMIFSPVLDVARDIRWGRIHETYGEDPELIARMGIAFIRGIQGKDGRSGLVATGKHFLGYASSLGGLNQGATQLGRRELRDVYAEPFRRAIADAGLRVVMNSYNDLDGVPAAANSWLLNDLLRTDLGFDGLVVSDYDSINMLWKTQRTAETPGDAAVQALSAGVDVELPGSATTAWLREQVEAGMIAERVIDEAVRRVLNLKADLGLVPDVRPHSPLAAATPVDHAAAAAVSQTIAEKALTLLSNNGILPLTAGRARVAVTGPAADSVRIHFGAYSSVSNAEMPLAMGQIMAGAIPGVEPSLDVFTDLFQVRLPGIDPLFEESARRLHPNTPTLASALQAVDSTIRHLPYGDFEDTPLDEEAICSSFTEVDVVIVAVGERTGWVGTHTAGEGRTTANPTLPGNQSALIRLLNQLGKRVITVLVTGRPLLVEEAHEASSAVLLAPLLGPSAGPAIARAVFGLAEPAGRLPSTFPRSLGQIPLFHGHPTGSGYDHPTLRRFGYTDLDNSRPLFAFGHGLGYTTFDLDFASAVVAGDTVHVTARVSNTGERAGSTVAQLYGRDEHATIVRPVRQLLDFSRVALEPGGVATVDFSIPLARLAYTLPDGRRGVEPGELTLLLGFSSDHITATRTVTTAPWYEPSIANSQNTQSPRVAIHKHTKENAS
ncbi:Periplasmic beta-glucosidase [Frondihabitans sp. 762G35]|uniref:glycoside hydrolase family 3 N-terminal domain-containing protein n=1 Tax=Frondihabitans sp. 762G35 TaxID=1446794 RepID=UPI000D223E2B|nr:glycoside hydrolase family 3 N-terminal domain-containing protein [Frondihabitans sp. 762G35]ARC58643.1 Periplasmic beta-glucosidase [Frondihabitans sp. 762G35]